MANKGRVQFAKRQKELARQERAKVKAARKLERKEAKARGEVVDDELELLTGPPPVEGEEGEAGEDGAGAAPGATEDAGESRR